jgi:hypothetical protein
MINISNKERGKPKIRFKEGWWGTWRRCVRMLLFNNPKFLFSSIIANPTPQVIAPAPPFSKSKFNNKRLIGVSFAHH